MFERATERANVCMFNGNVSHEVGLELMKRDKHSRNAEWISLLIQKKIAFFVLVGDTKKSQSLEAVRSIHPCRPDSDTAESRREWHCCSRQVRSLVAAAAGRSPKRTYTRRVNIDTCRSTLNNMFSFLFSSLLCWHVLAADRCRKTKDIFAPKEWLVFRMCRPKLARNLRYKENRYQMWFRICHLLRMPLAKWIINGNN